MPLWSNLYFDNVIRADKPQRRWLLGCGESAVVLFLHTSPAVAKGVVYVTGALDWTLSSCVAITTFAMETHYFLITLGVCMIFTLMYPK